MFQLQLPPSHLQAQLRVDTNSFELRRGFGTKTLVHPSRDVLNEDGQKVPVPDSLMFFLMCFGTLTITTTRMHLARIAKFTEFTQKKVIE
jgi:hypothetical protein